MTRGWFDLFRDDGGPTLYPEANRTSVIADAQALTVYIVFSTLLLAFFVVMPGIRKQRFTTFTSVILSLFVGASALIGICGSGWHTAEAQISSAYRSFSNEKIQGRIGIYVGLDHVNITLLAMPEYYNHTMDVAFNERFGFEQPDQLQIEFKKALKKGLPFPILTVAEYMSVDAEGFCWGRNYRQAGYYTSFFLWVSFACWILMNMMIVIVPRYGAYLMSLTGAVMLFADIVYFWLLPSRPLKIPFEGVTLEFELGWCFWLTLTAGGLCLMIGVSISVIDLIYPHKFSIVMEMDYGTPFDRHTIIEDSHETKKKKKWVPKLEDPNNESVYLGNNGFGGLWRRFSKRDRERGMDIQNNPGGVENYGFDMDMPKSPWRYPHLMFRTDSRKSKAVSFKQNPAFDPNGMLRRTDSKESNCSTMTSMSHREDLRQTLSVPVSAFHKQFKRTDSNDSNSSSLASFGLSLLSRNNSKKHQLNKRLAERTDSDISRGFVLPPSSLATVSSPPATGNATATSGSGVEVLEVEDMIAANNNKGHDKKDEVAILVGSRKNSMTKAVRRNSAEHKRDEASMW